MADLSIGDGGADERALFVIVGPPEADSVRVRPTNYTRGPWDHECLHGGPVGGLMAWGAERLLGPNDNLLCGRLTVELLSAVPRAELEVNASVIKPGRRSRVIDVQARHRGALVARASSQWLQPGATGSPASIPPLRPDVTADPGSTDLGYPRPGFNCDAAELRYVRGSNEESGPATIWARLTSPVIAGEETSPLATIATLTDFAAAAGWEEGEDGAAHINPDLTLQLMRYPAGDWIAIDAGNRQAAGAVGYNEATLYDDRGVIGRVLQSLVVAPSSPLNPGP